MIQKEIKSCLNRNLIFVQEYEKNLEILNPLSILDRGYSIIQNQSGKSIKSNTDVKIGENNVLFEGQSSKISCFEYCSYSQTPI